MRLCEVRLLCSSLVHIAPRAPHAARLCPQCGCNSYFAAANLCLNKNCVLGLPPCSERSANQSGVRRSSMQHTLAAPCRMHKSTMQGASTAFLAQCAERACRQSLCNSLRNTRNNTQAGPGSSLQQEQHAGKPCQFRSICSGATCRHGPLLMFLRRSGPEPKKMPNRVFTAEVTSP